MQADERYNYEECSESEQKNHIYKSVMAVKLWLVMNELEIDYAANPGPGHWFLRAKRIIDWAKSRPINNLLRPLSA